MISLYELSGQAAQLLELLENGDIDEQIFNDTMEAMGVPEKVESCCQVVTQLNSDIDMIDAEINRLAKKKNTLENNVKWLKTQLYNFYISSGAKKIKAGTFTVSARNSTFVDIIDNSKIPKKYLRIKTEPDKTAIRTALEQGVKVNGASISTKVSVQIR